MLMQHKMHFGGPPMPEFPHPHVAINFVRHRERDLRLSVLSLIIDATDGPAPANHSRAENIGSALKRGVNVCQRQFVNEVLGPLVRSSFAILAARTRHRFSTLSQPQPSRSLPNWSNSSDIVHFQAFEGAPTRQLGRGLTYRTWLLLW
jgi:hypothetical protein